MKIVLHGREDTCPLSLLSPIVCFLYRIVSPPCRAQTYRIASYRWLIVIAIIVSYRIVPLGVIIVSYRIAPKVCAILSYRIVLSYLIVTQCNNRIVSYRQPIVSYCIIVSYRLEGSWLFQSLGQIIYMAIKIHE